MAGEEVEGTDDQPCGADGCVAAGESACVVEAVALLVEARGVDEHSLRGDVVASLRAMARRLEETHPQGRNLVGDTDVREWAARLRWLLDAGPSGDTAHRSDHAGDPG